MDQSSARSTPMNGYKGLQARGQDNAPGDRSMYQHQMGKMMFSMVYTRPDICFSLSKLSQYMSDPSAAHDVAIKHVLRYLRGSYKLRLKYGPTQKTQEHIRLYSDSDYAADKDGRRSTLGYVAMLGGGAVLWASRRQKSISTLTSEAEYYVVGEASKTALWIRQFFIQLQRP